MNEVILETSLEYKNNWFKKIYADDLAVIVKKVHIYNFIRIIRDKFNKYGLIFNNKKS